MSTIWQSFASLAAAGAVLLSGALDTAAPHNANGELLLVNRQWQISERFVPEVRVASLPGQLRKLQPAAAEALEEMVQACKEETGAQIMSVSGYRSYERQERVYNNKLKSVKGNEEEADEYVARPGSSEHQTGLSIDIGQKGSKTNSLGASFAKTKSGQWVAENCWRFGFIIRYQQGWEDVTGYEWEPWHIRYVGRENAARIHESPMPLEEYILLVRTERLLALLEAQQ